MAGSFFWEGRFEQAADYYQKMAAIYASDPGLGLDSVKYAWALTWQARAVNEAGKANRSQKPEQTLASSQTRTQALELCRKALAIIGGQTPENNHYDALYLREIKDNTDSVMGESEAEAERKKHPEMTPPKLAGLAISEIPDVKVQIAQTKRTVHKHADSTGKHDRAGMKEVLYLANLYTLDKDYAEAEPLFKEVLSFAESQYGHEHAMLLTPLANYGYMLKEAGRASEAQAVHTRLIAIWKAAHQN